jgi:hypothetical protein
LATQLLSPTRNGLLPEARHVILPDGIVSSGFPSTFATCQQVGLDLDAWQRGIAKCILAKDASGDYAADTVVISIPRQAGKTYLIGALVFAECIKVPGTTVVWTAHRFKVSRETFNALKSIALSEKLAPHVDPDDIFSGAGNESIGFRNGSRIVFAARERGAIRGFAKVRIIVLDEAQILTESAMADLAPTMNQAINPQIILTGTPPKPTDPGEVFANLRTEALAGRSEGVVYVEFSADPDLASDDRRAWRQSNPSHPRRTPAKAIVRLLKLLPDDDFRREALGIWDDLSGGWKVIRSADWRACEDPASHIDSAPVFVLDVSPMSSHACLLAAGLTADGRSHVEITSSAGVLDYRPGVGWVGPHCRSIVQRLGRLDLWIVAGSAAEALVPELSDAGVTVNVLSKADYASACVRFVSRVASGDVVHLGQRELTAAVGAGAKRTAADEGLWIWGRGRSSADVAPLVAATAGDWLAQTADYDVMASGY